MENSQNNKQETQNIVIRVEQVPKNGIRSFSCVRIRPYSNLVEYISVVDNDFLSNLEGLLVSWSQPNTQISEDPIHYVLNFRHIGSLHKRFQGLLNNMSLNAKLEDKTTPTVSEIDIIERIFKEESKFLLRTQNWLVEILQIFADRESWILGRPFVGHFKLRQSSLDNFLRLDVPAVQALNIFPDQRDSCSQKSISVFETLGHHVITQMGLRALQEWLLQPLRSVEEINFRTSCVKMYTLNGDLRREARHLLRRVPNLDRLLSNLWRQVARGGTFFRLPEVVSVYRLSCELNDFILRTTEVMSSDTELSFHDLLRNISNDLSFFREKVENMVDVGGTTGERTASIRPECSTQLTSINKKIESLELELSKLTNYTTELFETTVELIPSGKWGWLFEAVKEAYFKAQSKDPSYKITSTRKRTLTFTHPSLEKIVVELQQLKDRYISEQEEFVNELVSFVESVGPILLAINQVLLEQDIFSGFAELMSSPSPNKSFCLPEFIESETPSLEIENK